MATSRLNHFGRSWLHEQDHTDVQRLTWTLSAGQLAGLLMVVAMMLVAKVFAGRDFTFPLQLIGSTLLGESHLSRPEFGPVMLGLLVHQLGPTLVWSLAFGVIAIGYRKPMATDQAVLLGFFLGGIAEIVDVYLLMQPFQIAVNGHNLWMEQVPRLWDWLLHFGFGTALGSFYALLQNHGGEQAHKR
jgi:hypothetical protein